MVISGSLQAAFAKLGVGNAYNEPPYDPYNNPEPERRLRRFSSQSMIRPRAPSLVQSACLNVQKIPAIVAVSGKPGAPAPGRGRASDPSSHRTGSNRHSIAGWHQILGPDGIDARYTYSRPSARPNDVPIETGSRTDRSQTAPAPIDLPVSLDFCDLDQDKPPYSAPSHQTAFGTPDARVTTSERRPAEGRYQYTPQPTTSYDFVDMDRSLPAALPVPRSTSSLSSTHRSPSPTMGRSYRSISPTAGHTPYYPGSQRSDSASSTTRADLSEAYESLGMKPSFPTPIHENSEYGAYYCTSPMPISAHGNAYGTSRTDSYDSQRDDTYDATRGGIYTLTHGAYDAMPEPTHDSARPRGGATYTTYAQTSGLSSIIGEMEDYNRACMARSRPAPSPPLTASTSVDGTINSPYED